MRDLTQKAAQPIAQQGQRVRDMIPSRPRVEGEEEGEEKNIV